MSEVLLVVAVVLLALILISAWVVFYQIIKQQGRMLLRLDTVESRLAFVNSRVASALPGPAPSPAQAPALPPGLEVGTPFAPFRLPDLSGNLVSLEDFKGKRVLLVNWNPGCGFCDLIAPDLAKLQPDLREHNVALMLVSHGDAEANRKLAEEHGLECPILLLKNGEQAIPAFENLGTPVAYLLDEEGRVAEPLAMGANQVPELAREAAAGGSDKKRLPGERPLSESRIERTGLKAGTPAPSFALPDVHGGTVSLEEYRGRRVLLVFSDPHCGPCEQLAPELARLHREHRDNNLAVVMVGRGDAEENRRKAEQYGFDFPVVLQHKWELSKQYGIFATPVGFLINEDGVIARNVAQGVDEILALAPEELATERRYQNGRSI